MESIKKLEAPDPWSLLPNAYSMVLIPGYWSSLEANLQRAASSVEFAPVWHPVRERLKELAYDYQAQTESTLLSGEYKFVFKSISSIKSKLVRDFFHDGKWRDEPFFSCDGLLIPNIGDLIRTRFVVEYLDAVGLIAKSLQVYLQSVDSLVVHKPKGEKEGYFAHHLVFKDSFIFDFVGNKYIVPLRIEVQIGTVSATRHWNLSHKIYETDREASPNLDWQWNSADPRFICHQLGHMLHLSEGLFVELRNKNRGAL